MVAWAAAESRTPRTLTTSARRGARQGRSRHQPGGGARPGCARQAGSRRCHPVEAGAQVAVALVAEDGHDHSLSDLTPHLADAPEVGAARVPDQDALGDGETARQIVCLLGGGTAPVIGQVRVIDARNDGARHVLEPLQAVPGPLRLHAVEANLRIHLTEPPPGAHEGPPVPRAATRTEARRRDRELGVGTGHPGHYHRAPATGHHRGAVHRAGGAGSAGCFGGAHPESGIALARVGEEGDDTTRAEVDGAVVTRKLDETRLAGLGLERSQRLCDVEPHRGVRAVDEPDDGHLEVLLTCLRAPWYPPPCPAPPAARR